MAHDLGQGAAFVAGGAAAGSWVSVNVGGMGLAFSGTAIGIGMTPVTLAGATAGAASYGLFRAVVEGDASALSAAALGGLGGAAVSLHVGGMGLAAKGTAISLGLAPLTVAGSVVGLAVYGLLKSLDRGGTKEPASQVFERMDSRVSWQESYTQALLELNIEALENQFGNDPLAQKFLEWQLDDDLEHLKKNLNIPSGASNATSQILTGQSLDRRFRQFQIDSELEELKAKMGLSLCSPKFSKESLLRLEAQIFSNKQFCFQRLENIACTFMPENKQAVGEWWQVLGVDQNATPTAVKQAYYQLAKRHHPDSSICTHAQANMQAVNIAYDKYQQRLKTLN
ncbi:Chaperone protein DnaJ [Acaryochloris thomasi RCC1774]|uniref:Chaperone protein DnaJ n=1 Tax=Acaryochloris thomasi RCC1774 TaxID=1764569 RepID=A0A2W1JUK7_9CYAN|nr:J domain-containing protein [Acaryochloris thomasi]PZD72227.1 Chaperone protein DnaJ [Acaryochloris thomasi RCC1774]